MHLGGGDAKLGRECKLINDALKDLEDACTSAYLYIDIYIYVTRNGKRSNMY